MSKLRVLLPTIDFFADIYEKNSTLDADHYDICTRFGRRSRKSVKLGYLGYVTVFVLLYTTGAIETWRSGGQAMMVHLYVPGIHDYSAYGIAFLIFLNTMEMTFACISTAPTDVLFFCTFGNVPMLSAIVQNLVNEMNALLHLRRRFDEIETKIRHRFVHYIGIHQKYNL